MVVKPRKAAKPSTPAGKPSPASPTPTTANNQLLTNPLLILVTLVTLAASYYFTSRPYQHAHTLVRNPSINNELLSHTGFTSTQCSTQYDELSGCSPPPRCGRQLFNDFVNADEVQHLRRMLHSALTYSNQNTARNSSVQVFDVASGAVSYKTAFADIQRLYAHIKQPVFAKDSVDTYLDITERIKQRIASTFDINADTLHLTKPSFLSSITNMTAHTPNDEYWHTHIDTLQYGSFTFTSLVYLSTSGLDFTGGEFVFLNTTATDSKQFIAPKQGQLLVFSSGDEHPHLVSKVTSGERVAITIAFTCDKLHALNVLQLQEQLMRLTI